jgi:hypothetical protein
VAVGGVFQGGAEGGVGGGGESGGDGAGGHEEKEAEVVTVEVVQ